MSGKINRNSYKIKRSTNFQDKVWTVIFTLLILACFLPVVFYTHKQPQEIQSTSFIQIPLHFKDNTDKRLDEHNELIITQTFKINGYTYTVGKYKKKSYIFSNGNVTKID